MSATSRLWWPIAALLAATTAARVAQAEVKFVINVLDAPGVGFNDNTPATPVGGNTGTTIGQQRLIAFQAAADAWGRVLESPVPIIVEASFAPLACTATGAVAGQAAPYAISNYPGLPTTETYPLALANRILGRDLFPDSADITAQFNGSLMACIGSDWYYGLDGKGSANESDLLSIVMHELSHGLGFTSDLLPDTGAFSMKSPPVFADYALDTDSGKHWPEMSDAERKASVTNVRKLVWDGPRVQAVAAWALAKGLPSVQVAPSLSGFSGFIGEANFGRLVADGATITGQVAAATVSASCRLGTTASGKIALVTSPPSCASLGAATIVEYSGGLAMLFAYDEAGTPPPVALEFRADEIALSPSTIPTLALTRDDANLLRSASSATVTLSADKSRQVGTDSAGRTFLFASNPVQPGSTGGHWDPLVRPNLLLEPVASPIPTTDLVMERALLWDIGWTGTCGNGSIDGQEECDNGAANSDRTPDACRLNCAKAKCGDGVVDSGEQCDPGSRVGLAPDPNCRSDCQLITTPGTGGASGSGGSSASGGSGGSGGTSGKGGAGGRNGGTTAGSGGSGGNSGTGGSSSAGGRNGGTTAGSGGSGGNSGTGGSSSAGGSGGTSASASSANPSGKSGGCSCDAARDSSALGFWLVVIGLALMLGRRRRNLAPGSSRTPRPPPPASL